MNELKEKLVKYDFEVTFSRENVTLVEGVRVEELNKIVVPVSFNTAFGKPPYITVSGHAYNTLRTKNLRLNLFKTVEDFKIESICSVVKETFTPRLVWARTYVDDNENPAWVPAFTREDGNLDSILGLLTNPDSEKDLREFDDCPFEGYEITRKTEEA